MNETATPFMPCPFCGQPIDLPSGSEQTTSLPTLVGWALRKCECKEARAWRAAGCHLITDSPCTSGKLLDGMCTWETPARRCTQEKCTAWHPEWYVPNLAAVAWQKYLENQDLAALLQDHAKDADLIRRVMACPAPEYWQKPIYWSGQCSCCGQTIILGTPAETRHQADAAATAVCKCTRATLLRKRTSQHDGVSEMFPGVEPEAVDALLRLMDLTRDGYVQPGSQIKMTKDLTAKIKMADDLVIVEAAEKHSHRRSF